MKIALILFVLLTLLFFVWRNVTIPKTIGVFEGELSPCPWTPNCVSSDAKDSPYAIEPLPHLSGDTLNIIEKYLMSHYDAEVVSRTPDYLHIVVTTPYFRFKDDLEFLVDKDKKEASIRSASRVGYSDLNTNRKRIKKLRHYLCSKDITG